ncbi:MAG: four helix bundle protein, partial [Planctomycetota bacterium]
MAEEVIERFPLGRAALADQSRRAALSVPLNIAEGVGEFSRQEKARFYRIALRPAIECAAILDVSRRLRLAKTRCDAARDLLLRVVAMLTRM